MKYYSGLSTLVVVLILTWLDHVAGEPRIRSAHDFILMSLRDDSIQSSSKTN